MKNNREDKQGLSLLLEWADKDKMYLFAAILCAFLSSLSSVIPYYSFYQVIDAVYLKTFTAELFVKYAGIIVLGIMLRYILAGGAGILSHKGAYNTLFRVRCLVTEHMSKMPLGSLNERSTGEIKTVMNENIEKLELFLAHHLPDLIMYLAGPLVMFSWLCTVNLSLALVSLIPLALALVVMVLMFIKSFKFMKQANNSMEGLNAAIIEYISGMRLIKAYNMGSGSFKKYASSIDASHSLRVEMSRKLGPLYASYIVVLECGLMFLVPLGGYWFLNGSITASILLLFAFVGTQYLTEIRPLQEMGSNLSWVLNGVAQVKNILDTPVFEGGEDFPARHDITMNNVSFSYTGDKEVLKDSNIHIAHGEKVAFIGESGTGKSTAVQLISRFYDVTKGKILIGGVNVKEIDYEKLLENISIVFQKSFLTRDSVLANIRMGGNYSLAEVREAAKKAQIDNFIMGLPDSYHTLVGSYGTRFSGGQKQRICIARAILKNAPILILDEATSAADPENQVEMDAAIRNLCKEKTVIIVAHRLGIAQECDRIAVVENNTIANIGTWDELLEKSAYFQKVWQEYNVARHMRYELKGSATK